MAGLVIMTPILVGYREGRYLSAKVSGPHLIAI